jgi:TonB-linked SusC/RagA family outer membrane protein
MQLKVGKSRLGGTLCCLPPPKRKLLTKTLFIMKITAFLILIACLQVSAKGYAQKKVTLSEKDAPLKKVFTAIRKQTGFIIFVNESLLEKAHTVTIQVTNTDLETALDLCLKNQPLTWSIVGNNIVIEQKKDAPDIKAAPAAPTGVINIHGRIVNESGEPVVASITVKGANHGTTSNNNGEFKLTGVDENATLLISATNIDAKEITLHGNNELVSITVKMKISPLDELQVIAYGTTTKRLNTGNVTTITAKDIEKNPVNNVLEAIQGKVPGLFIQQVTGQPGGAFNIRMRGSANFASDAPQPLIVVDGVTYPGGTLPVSTSSLGPNNYLQGGSGLNYLNPNDIESINVLKDADATALYGSSGAYGVVIITTKKARVGKPTLNANVYTGVSVLGETPKLMNTEQYVMLRREALANDGLTATANDKDVNGTWPEDRSNDYKKELLGNSAQNTNANVSYGGGVNNTSYLISGSLRKYGNIQRHKGSSGDGTLRFSLNSATPDNKFNIGVSGTYLSSKSTMVPMDFSSDIALAAPNAPPIFLPDGSINWETGGTNLANDLADDINRIYENVTNNFLASSTLSYKPVRNFTVRTLLNYNNISGKEFIGYPTTTLPPGTADAALRAQSVFHHFEVRTITVSPYLEYNATVLDRGSINVTTGGKLDNRLKYWDEISGKGFASDALLSNPSAGASVTSTYSQTPYRYLGFHGAVKFVWDQKYIINLNGRRDGSTKFGSGKKFGNFGSVAVAWIFSEEKWMRDHLSFINYGKLRASKGVVGGDAVRDFAYLSTYSVLGGSYQGATGLSPNGLANPLLNWEKNKNGEVAIELGFLNDRIYAEVDHYRNIASNQLISNSLSTVTGYGTYDLNSDAVIRTSGWEISLNTTNFKSKDFTWSTRFNISIPRSKLVKLPTNIKLDTKYILDKPVTGVLLYQYEGINPQTGYYSFTNAKGVTADYDGGLNNGLISTTDKTAFLDLAPKYYGGFQNSFRYKQWALDFSFTFTNRVGKNFLGQSGYMFGYIGVNGGTYWLNRWQKPGDVTDIPKVSTNLFGNLTRHGTYFKESTGAYSNATYARLQNLSIKYRVTDALLHRMHLHDLSVYLQGQNLLTISKYGGLDPENLSVGIIPPMRVFTAGINLSL